MYRYVIGKSSNGNEVYVNLISSSAGHYLSRQPYLINVLKEILSAKSLRGPEVSMEHEMGRIIGNTDIVETSDKDTILYAQPNKKTVFSRYAKNRSPSPSSKVTIFLVRDETGSYELIDTWIGLCSPPFPGDEKATADSKTYWEEHALVLDTQLIQSKSITKVCPY